MCLVVGVFQALLYIAPTSIDVVDDVNDSDDDDNLKFDLMER